MLDGGLAIDAYGGVILAGTTAGSLGEVQGGGGDVFVARFMPNGDLHWVRQVGYNTGQSLGIDASGSESVGDMEIDSRGSIYLGGQTNGSLFDIGNGSTDVMAMRLSPEGRLLVR